MNVMKTGMLLAALTALFMGVGYLVGGSGGAFIAFLVAAGMNLFSYWNADKLVLRMHSAQRGGRARARRSFYAIVGELAARAGLPMPKLYLIDNPQPNAFATGRNPQNAAVAATTGLLQQLSREEIAGVMAHELAHVKNRDTLTMTIAATIAGAISMLANFAFFFGGNRNNPLGIVGVLLAAITAPLAAMLIQMAISRTREYSADRDGAAIAGNPLWLASALGKIARAAGRVPMMTRRAQSRHRAALHRQSADRRAHGQSLLHASRRPRTASPRCRRWRSSGGVRRRRRSAASAGPRRRSIRRHARGRAPAGAGAALGAEAEAASGEAARKPRGSEASPARPRRPPHRDGDPSPGDRAQRAARLAPRRGARQPAFPRA